MVTGKIYPHSLEKGGPCSGCFVLEINDEIRSSGRSWANSNISPLSSHKNLNIYENCNCS